MYIRVRATPDARRERVERVSDTEFAIAVQEPAERNMANMRICELIAHEFGVSRNRVRITTGHRSHTKVLSVEVY
jgi:uncharacterized protein YggU (UPF0235/DUF167 family)